MAKRLVEVERFLKLDFAFSFVSNLPYFRLTFVFRFYRCLPCPPPSQASHVSSPYELKHVFNRLIHPILTLLFHMRRKHVFKKPCASVCQCQPVSLFVTHSFDDQHYEYLCLSLSLLTRYCHRHEIRCKGKFFYIFFGQNDDD